VKDAKKPRMQAKRIAARGQHVVPSWHFGMLNDHPRNTAYRKAIEYAVEQKPGSRVLDLGCGSGLLSMMAVRAGATTSVCCELEPPIATTATRIVEQNGLKASVTVKNKDCTALEMSDLPAATPARILVSEMIDTGLLGDEWLTLLNTARQKELITPDASVVPRAATVYAAGVELLPQARPVFAHHPAGAVKDSLDLSYFNLAGANMTAIADVRLHEIAHKRLTTPENAFDFDFEKVPLDMNREHQVTLKASATGTVHAIAFWFTMDLGGGAQINTSPDTEDGPESHWKQAMQLLQQPVTVRTVGQELTFMVSHDPSRIAFEYISS